MHIYPSGHSLILQDLVVSAEMTHPTERHNFTFGCYRAQHAPSVDERGDDATDETADPTPVTDGGAVAATTCPACENDLANVQGVPACTHCTWNGR